jgi:hypothetical protein
MDRSPDALLKNAHHTTIAIPPRSPPNTPIAIVPGIKDD